MAEEKREEEEEEEEEETGATRNRSSLPGNISKNNSYKNENQMQNGLCYL
jgi:hypothetical protein